MNELNEMKMDELEEEEMKFQGQLNEKPEQKPNLIKRGVSWLKDHKSAILKATGVVAVGVVSYVLGTKVSQLSADSESDGDDIKRLELFDASKEETDSEETFDQVEESEETEETED